MSNLHLITQTRIDVPVRVKARAAIRRLEQLADANVPDEDALSLIAEVIADLVLVERYLTDPRTRWTKGPTP